MKNHFVSAVAVIAPFAFAASVGCGGGSTGPRAPTEVVQATDFEILPLARNCPAVTPVTLNGLPGNPATFTFTFSVNVTNATSKDITIQSVSSTGSVTAASDDAWIGRPANVGTAASFSPTALTAGQTAKVTGAFTFLCGDNPDVRHTAYWDILMSLTVSTTKGLAGSTPVTFRRNWDPCDGGHPCPAVQPPLPSN